MNLLGNTWLYLFLLRDPPFLRETKGAKAVRIFRGNPHRVSREIPMINSTRGTYQVRYHLFGGPAKGLPLFWGGGGLFIELTSKRTNNAKTKHGETAKPRDVSRLNHPKQQFYPSRPKNNLMPERENNIVSPGSPAPVHTAPTCRCYGCLSRESISSHIP